MTFAQIFLCLTSQAPAGKLHLQQELLGAPTAVKIRTSMDEQNNSAWARVAMEVLRGHVLSCSGHVGLRMVITCKQSRVDNHSANSCE